MPFTISLLPASLSLVHVPRSRLHQLSTQVLRQILQPEQSFLNVTCNEIELSLFIEHHMLQHFEPIARRDHRKHRSSSAGPPSNRKKYSAKEPVEVSYEKWSVLQIDSHSDGLDNSGARVHELSAPLASAGISILYQSSYMCDFIFIKEARIREAMNLFASAGFDLHPQDSNVLTSSASPPLSPIQSEHFSSDSPLERIPNSDIDTSLSSLTSILENTPTESSATNTSTPVSSDGTASVTPTITQSRAKSHSPLSGDVRALDSDLACVGLSDDSVDNWGLKIVKLVAFPDLIPLPTRSPSTATTNSRFQTLASQPPSFSHASPTVTRGRPSFSSISSSSSSDDDVYFSHSPTGNNSSSSLVTSAASRSNSDLTKLPVHSPSTSKHRVASLPSLSSIIYENEPKPPPMTITTRDPPAQKPHKNGDSTSRVPFFSFTRTPEGSSLTTDVSLLAALFPPHERHMVICSGELDAADDRNASAVDVSDDEEDNDHSANSILRCLQVDLRRFGLDKHGLVNRFSRVLEENGVNHMYSSTFKTANLLVDKRKSIRAQSLLRSC